MITTPDQILSDGGHRRRWRIALIAVAALVLCRVTLNFDSNGEERRLASDITSVGMSTAMSLSLLVAAFAARSPSSRFASGWLLLGLAMIMWLVADLLWLRADLQGVKPSGTLSDIFFLLFYPLFLAGVLCLPRQSRSALGWVRLALDLAVATLAALVVLWVLIVSPTIESLSQGGTPDRLELLIALAYPTGDLLVLWAALALIATGRVDGMVRSSRLLAASAALLVVTDTIYGYQVLQGTYHSGNCLGIGWSGALGLVGLAGAAAQPPRLAEAASTNRTPHPALGSLILSSVSFAIAWLVVSSSPRAPGLQFAEGGVLAMIVLTVVRQAVGLIENRTLTVRLQALNDDLDARVQERTADLETANERLRQAQKMEAIGRLAGGVAHDFNNLLTVIIGNAALLRRQFARDQVVSDQLDSISTTAGRAAELTRQLLAFSRRTPLTPQATDLTMIVGEVDTMLRRVLPAEIRLVIDHRGPPPVVYADPGQVVQVVMNLAINARDALPAGGTLTIATSTITLSDIQVAQMPDSRTGPFAVLTVSDTGIGMDEATRGRLFEPFFTTKPPGAGTGLGLATVHGIVRQSGGWIVVESALGQGSAFHVYLDLIRDPPSSVTRAMVALAPIRLEGTRILLVEDEPAVRLIAFHTLTALGCVVFKAGDAEEALAIFRANPGGIDLVISDGIMPGMHGPALIAKLRERAARLPAVLCSGYTGEESAEIQGDMVFLAKPFTAETLATAVNQALHPPV